MLARQVKALAMLQYTMITGAWIFITQEIRFNATDFTPTGLWQYRGLVLAPYGLPWYFAYKLFTNYGIVPFILSQWTIGFVGVTIMARGWRNWMYGIVGGALWFLWIDDMVYFVLAAYGKWYTSLAALLIKLPLGAPLYVWSFIFHTSVGGLFYENIARYLLLGLLTVQPFISKVWSLAR